MLFFFYLTCSVEALPKEFPSKRKAGKVVFKIPFYFSAQTQRRGAVGLMSADSARCSYVALKREVTSPLTRRGVKESAAGPAGGPGGGTGGFSLLIFS